MTKKQKNKLIAKAKRLLAKPPTSSGQVGFTVDFSDFNDGFTRGVEAAASFVEEWDEYVNSSIRLSDMIRYKLNIPAFPKRKMRTNTRKHVIVGTWNK